MRKLIYLDTAIDAIIKESNTDGAYGYMDTKSIVDLLNDQPSAQPEIVRCKDCKYWRKHKYVKETKKYIPFCGFNAIYTKSDDFCSRAERREE